MRRYIALTVVAVLAAFGFAALPPVPTELRAAPAPSCPASLTGGTVTTVGDDCVLKWTTVGSYTWTVPADVAVADVLVVAGGGGGGADAAGGGGAGGLIHNQGTAVSGSISLSVGGGGVGGQNSAGRVAANGQNSTFGGLTAIGGGKGGTYRGGAGAAGGSGGGGGFDTGTAGAGTAGQGNAGGASARNGWCECGIPGPAGGGGGGAGGAGIAGNTGDGNGGPGLQISITGTAQWYAGGGGGGRWSVVTSVENGGSGVGGRGAGSCGANPSTAGAANTGSGGGGAPAGCQTYGSAGGSGVVIVRYALPDVAAPTFSSASIDANGTLLTATFNESMSATVPAVGAFTVSAAGSNIPVSSVTASGSTLRLALSRAVTVGAAVTLSYADPSGGDDANAAQDTAGNDAASFGPSSVTNNSTATTTTTTTTTVAATTTTLAASGTTAAPALVINVSAPTTLPVSIAGAVTTTPSLSATVKQSKKAKKSKLVPASVTTTTMNIATSTTAPPPAPADVSSGQAAVEVGGVAQASSVERIDNKIIVTAGDVRASFGSLSADGVPTVLDEAGNIRLKSGDKIDVNLDGFTPSDPVRFYLYSTPVLLGESRVGEDGSVSARVEIPQGVESGPHRIVVETGEKSGDTTKLTLGILVGDWKKEGGIAGWLIAGPIIAAVLGALFLPAVFRRRRRETAVA